MNEEYIRDFENYLNIDLNYSKNTVVSYVNDLEKFITYYKNIDMKEVMELNSGLNFLENI